ncbi:hypothetical protein TWF481_004027 [Arthrobotrys musiformis]|uniref:DUF6604 domain-containing protein n=1 Tax=Arthrobotrys musiformis TaxID=47236 RepID=A0AAV9WID6_9PEZI
MPALPEAIFNTYKRYKAGTNRNKDKKQKPVSKPDSNNYTIRDLVTFARTIIDKNLSVPSHLLSILQDVINARSQCAKWYRSQPSADSTIKHETHEHFIRVLEEIHTILKPAEVSILQSAEKPEEPDSSSPPKLKNLFDYLESEEPLSKDFGNATDSSSFFADESTTAKKKKPFDPEEARIEEQLFALFCFFQDVAEFRLFIENIWRDYTLGNSSLASTAITTCAAIEFIRQANEELALQFPDAGEHPRVVFFFTENGYAVEGLDGKGFGQSYLQEFEEEADPETPPLSISLCIKSWLHVLIPRIREDAETPPILSSKNGKMPKPKTHMDEVEYSDALMVDYLFLSLTIPADFHGMGYPILQGFRKATEARILPPWLVISFDIIRTLRQKFWLEGPKQPYDELQAHMESIKKQLSSLVEFSKTWKASELPQLASTADKITQLIDEPLGIISLWTDGDIVQRLKSDWNLKPPEDFETEKFFLIQNDPVLCGLVLSHIQRSVHKLGLDLAALDSVVGLTAQVYNAGLVTGRLKSRWTDMEDLIKIHALENRIFVGGCPDTLEGCSTRYFAMMGFSVQSRAKGGTFLEALKKLGCGEKLPYKMLRDPRYMKYTSVYTEIAVNDFKWFPGKLTTGLTDMVGRQIQRYINLKEESYLNEFEDPDLDETMIEQWKKHHKLSQLQSLEVLYKTLEADQFHLNFDYFSMIETCTKFLCAGDEASKGPIKDYMGEASLVTMAVPGQTSGPCPSLSDIQRENNLSIITKQRRNLTYIDVDVVPGLTSSTDLPNPFEQLLLKTIIDIFPNPSVHIIELNAESKEKDLSGELASQCRDLLAQIDDGVYDDADYSPDLEISRRQAMLWCFLELLEKHQKAGIKRETVIESKRTVLMLATRPELPLEDLEDSLEDVCEEVAIFPKSLEDLKNVADEALSYRQSNAKNSLETEGGAAQETSPERKD